MTTLGLNRSSRRKKGMACNPLFIIPDFFCISPMKFAMATLDLKEMGNFPIFFKPKVVIAEFY